MANKGHKKTWIAVLLNFFIYGLGYIYLRKKIGLGILLLILDMVSFGFISNSFSNLGADEVFFWVLVGVWLALDAYRLSTGHRITALSESSQKIGEKILDTLIVLLVISLLLHSIVSTLNPKEAKSLSLLQTDVKTKTTQELQSQTKVVKIYINTFPSGVDKKYENSIREAMSFYERISSNLSVSLSFIEVSKFSEADVYINWFKEFGTGSLGHTINQKGIDIGLGDSNCLERWRPYTYDTVLHIAKHELGHALGADDDYEHPDTLMYYKFLTKYEIDIEESDVLSDGWSTFYPVCTKNDVAIYSFEVTSTEPLDIYIVPSRQDYELFRKGLKFTHYPPCQEEKVKFYEKKCPVLRDFGIILKNPSELLGGNTAQFKIKVKES